MREMGGCCLICHFLIWKIIFYSVSYLLSAFIGCWLPSLSLVCMGGDRLCCTKQKSRPTSGQDAAALWLPLSDAWSALTGCWNTGLSIGSQEHRPLRTAYKRFFEHGKGWGTLKVVIFWVLQQYFSSLLDSTLPCFPLVRWTSLRLLFCRRLEDASASSDYSEGHHSKRIRCNTGTLGRFPWDFHAFLLC